MYRISHVSLMQDRVLPLQEVNKMSHCMCIGVLLLHSQPHLCNWMLTLRGSDGQEQGPHLSTHTGQCHSRCSLPSLQ